MKIVEEYIQYQNKYQDRFGEKSVVLMEVGSFFELYGIDNETLQWGNIREVCDVLNITVTRKNKQIVHNSKENPLMAGFPNYCVHKFINMLLKKDYTVVLVEQDSHGIPNPGREVTNIYSPGTNIDFYNSYDSNHIFAIYLEQCYSHKYHAEVTMIGISIIDVTTCHNYIYEACSKKDDNKFALDEVYRLLQMYNPKEVIFLTPDNSYDLEAFKNYLEIGDRVVHFQNVSKHQTNKNYQEQFLEKVFQNQSALHILEYLHLDTCPLAIISYIALLQFTHEHNEKLITKLRKPQLIQNQKHLILTHNSIHQLNIVGDRNYTRGKYDSLLGVINNCSTSFGKRLLKERLLNPILDVDELRHRYSLVSWFLMNYEPHHQSNELKGGDYIFHTIENFLSTINDIERLHRKMAIGYLEPSVFAGLDLSYYNILAIVDFLQEVLLQGDDEMHSHLEEYPLIRNILPKKEVLKTFKTYMLEYNSHFEMEELRKCNFMTLEKSIFQQGVFPEVDKIQTKIATCFQFFQKLAETLNPYVEVKKAVAIRVDKNDRDGYFLALTKRRSEVLKKNLHAEKKKIIIKVGGKNYPIKSHEITYKIQGNNAKIFTQEIRQQSNNLVFLLEKLKKVCKEKYSDLLEKYDQKYAATLGKITEFIAHVDVIKSSAKTALQYHYCCPQITEKSEQGCDSQSYIKSHEMRHPIIERIQTQIEYIPNDVYIGLNQEKMQEEGSDKASDNSEETDLEKNSDLEKNVENNLEKIDKNSENNFTEGMLLYGCNACGKSSYMKAVGLNLILAQAGFFVAAKTFQYWPYQYLFTRISGNDNIFKGHSSFAVEMLELRNILKRATRNSLVLGDELCKGTEDRSGIAIVASGICSLMQKKAHFIFATHLHQLPKIQEIQALAQVKTFHLSVKYEEGVLIYDRQLKPGSGDSLYGLEVCKAMNLDPQFMKLANSIRQRVCKVEKEVLDSQRSNYNHQLFMDTCRICLKEKAIDTHHIKFQKEADQNNMIGHIPKNNLSNLVPLCEKCHDAVHHGKLMVAGYQQTGEGKKLQYTQLSKKEDNMHKTGQKKLSPTQVEIVFSYKDKYQLSRKKVCQLIQQKEELQVTPYLLKKVWDKGY